MTLTLRLRITGAIASLAGALLAVSLAHAAMTPIVGDPIAVSGGRVSGTRLPDGVKAYLGVPYAEPPVGALRWRPPQPIVWTGVWNADRKGPECPQVMRPHGINHYFGEEAMGEDCLYLNVWTPPGAKVGDHLPVIVFIYGGGGTIGSSGLANYDGQAMARRGAIFVNFNYRLGLLGFLAHPELSREQGGRSGNYGYLDQNAALRWVHLNIAAFGGDPAKVVLTGQSFGAGSVSAQVISPLSKGLFRAAMMSSACVLADGGLFGSAQTLATSEAVGLALQRRLGVPDLAALRDVPADRIIAQQTEAQLGLSVPGLRAPATLDGLFFTGSKIEMQAQHLGSDVPIIASSNGDDIDASQNALIRARTVADYEATARRLYGSAADAFLKLYPAKTDAEVQPMAHRAAEEGGFLEASRQCAELKTKFGRSPTYIDLFDHKHPYAPGVRFADQDPATVGAYHTADVPYWFDTLDQYNVSRHTRDWGPKDRQLTDDMSGALIAMANTGSPSTPNMPWPIWTEADPRYLVIGADVSVRRMVLDRMDWQVAHPNPGASAEARPPGPRD